MSTSGNNAGSEGTSVNIVTRSMWGALEPNLPTENLQTPVPQVIIGHTVTANDTDSALIRQQCRTFQNIHMETFGLGDIGYNFLIGCDGEVYEGRGFEVVGAHTRAVDKTSIGIAFIGNFTEIAPPSVSLQKCKALLKMGVDAGFIVPNYQVLGQSDFQAHDSPGRMLYNQMLRLKN